MRAEEDYFAVLGAPRRFAQDVNSLEKNYYRLSRALHPDRFTSAPEAAKNASLARMSFLNDAYQTLKNPAELRDYYLKQSGVALPESRPQIPLELAENWFEIQDAISEDPKASAPQLEAFQADLERLKSRKELELRACESSIDALPKATQQSLEQLSKLIQSQSYLLSLERDVERMKKRFLSALS